MGLMDRVKKPTTLYYDGSYYDTIDDLLEECQIDKNDYNNERSMHRDWDPVNVVDNLVKNKKGVLPSKTKAIKAAEEKAAAEAIAIEKRMEAEAKAVAKAKAEAEHTAALELTQMLQEAYRAAKEAAEQAPPEPAPEPEFTYEIPVDIQLLIGNLGITGEKFLEVKKQHMDETDLEVINIIIKG